MPEMEELSPEPRCSDGVWGTESGWANCLRWPSLLSLYWLSAGKIDAAYVEAWCFSFLFIALSGDFFCTSVEFFDGSLPYI